MKKKLIIGLALVFGGLIAYNVIKTYLIKRYLAHYHPPAATVSAVKVREQTWQSHINAVGNFVAKNGVDVNSQTAGAVVTIHFHSGQTIEANAPLVDLDDRIEQANLKSKQSELALQRINYQRQADLFKRGAAPKSIVDEAEARRLQAEADVERSSELIRQKHITAPFAGRLGIRQVNLGQYISPGQNTLVTLQSMDPLYLEFYLPEHLIKHAHLQQTIFFSIQQMPSLLFEAEISAINAKVDSSTHNVLIQATLANCPRKALKDPLHSPLLTGKKQNDGKILVQCQSKLNQTNNIQHFSFLPGMFAAIEIPAAQQQKALVLPSTAISYSLYGNAVYVIEKDKKDPSVLVAKRVYVTTGEQEGNDTVILSGLKPNQMVVSSGELKLQDGSPVIINNDVHLNTEQYNPSLGE
jgi:membrane fusion protein (multidrug efflux system)